MEKAQGRRTDLATSSNDVTKLQTKAETLADAGISKQEASRYEALAAMPAEHFETAGRCAMLDSRNIAPHHPVASFLLGWLVDFAPNCLFLIEKLAEAVRFELTEGANPRWFSRPVP